MGQTLHHYRTNLGEQVISVKPGVEENAVFRFIKSSSVCVGLFATIDFQTRVAVSTRAFKSYRAESRGGAAGAIVGVLMGCAHRAVRGRFCLVRHKGIWLRWTTPFLSSAF